jgi:RNA 2',3'-cyclic 3'-phosphodiesterase
MSSKRLFVGIELPTECKTALRALDRRLPGLRWLPGSQLHLTLSFLGEIESAKQELLAECLREVRVPPFFLPLQGVGSFNVRGRPSVVWVGIGKGHPHLFALHKHIQDAVLRAGLEPDLKPFHPHVTVARTRGISRQALQPFLREHREAELGLFKVTEFTLFSSVLSSEGAAHTIEMQVPLAHA